MVIGLLNPYHSKRMTKIELFNESVIMITIYHLLIFSEFVPDASTRFSMGYVLILILAFSVVINMIDIYNGVIKAGYRKWKYSKLRKRRDQKILEIKRLNMLNKKKRASIAAHRAKVLAFYNRHDSDE